MTVALIGHGKLGLGFVYPSLNRDNAEVFLVVRDKSAPNVKTLRETGGYVKKVIGDEMNPETLILVDPDHILTYEEAADKGLWKTVDVVVTSVGMAHIPAAAASLKKPFEERVHDSRMTPNAKRVAFVAFENGQQPATELLRAMQRRSRVLAGDSRAKDGGLLVPCNAIVDSMCRLEVQDSGLVAYGQSRPSAIVFVPEESALASTLKRVFLPSVDDGSLDIQTLTGPESDRRYIETLFECKKAWLVNGLDYIASAYAITQHHLFLREDDIRDLSSTMNTMAGIADAALRFMHERGHAAIDLESLVGPDSFLGSCAGRAEIVKNNLKTYAKSRNCFETFADLGKHFDILTRHYPEPHSDFRSSRFSAEDLGNLQRSNVDALTEAQQAIVSLHERYSANGAAPSADSGSFSDEITKVLRNFYSSLNFATFAEKVRSRLLVVPEPPELDALDKLDDEKVREHEMSRRKFAAQFQTKLNSEQVSTLFYAIGLQFDAIAVCAKITTSDDIGN